jgi:hypothetical protein
MDPALFFGFPMGDVAQYGVEPFARGGIVAYTAKNPDLNIDGRPLADDTVFLVDAPAFLGNSGGPVIREPRVLRAEIELWGLVTGMNLAVGKNYTIVTSVKRISETLVYARSIAKIDSNAWDEQLPRLPLKCDPP